ncbi:MAG: hypothetical protein CMJ48_03385 [Planctomycetaceae bacterium]|nr:hypothetical protein [Planctomycetaceae bacterium]
MTATPLSLDPEQCRGRQRWLAETLAEKDADRALLVQPEHVQYFTGFRPHRLMQALVCIDADGHCTLVAPNTVPEDAAADAVATFEAQWHSTLRQEQMAAAARSLADALQTPSASQRTAVEFSSCPPILRETLDSKSRGELVDFEPALWQRRRNKDPDELAMIRRAIRCTEAMYARARTIIQPGITELEVFNQLHAAAVEIAGEPLTALGNDYQCNSPGGAPRPRAAQAGELFVLDLGPAYRGYYADNCRTISVDGRPSDVQQQAWEAIVAALEMVEQTVRPGVRCREVFETSQQMLDGYRVDAFFHHLGHGCGLFPHEAPHLNPRWDDVFAEGDVFTAEPGLYGPELKAGIRLEQNYRVTSDGVELLTEFSLEL